MKLVAWTIAIASCFSALLLVSVPTNSLADEAVWAKLRDGTAVALMRHALAPGTGDPDRFDVSDCTTQRNLDDRGRQQARVIGDVFRENGIEAATVLSSQWCRCIDTAQLLSLGDVQQFPALNSFFEDRSTRDEQTAAVRDYLATEAIEGPLVLVTHQVNITALTGRFASSGEMIVITVGEDGSVDVVGEIAVPW